MQTASIANTKLMLAKFVVTSPRFTVCSIPRKKYYNEKSAQRDANTARWLYIVRRSQKFSPRRRPLPGGIGRPKFN